MSPLKAAADLATEAFEVLLFSEVREFDPLAAGRPRVAFAGAHIVPRAHVLARAVPAGPAPRRWH